MIGVFSQVRDRFGIERMATDGVRGRTKGKRERPAQSGRQLKTAELVALHIVRDIVDQSLQPGDPLMLEAEMLAHYGVSRSSLREGLRLLETQGLITIRPGPGSGTLVSDVSPSNLGRTMTLHFHMANTSYDELLDTWLTLEPIVAEFAARNPDEARRRELMAPFLDGSADDCMTSISTGLNFHDAVADLANNRALSILCRAIGFIVSEVGRKAGAIVLAMRMDVQRIGEGGAIMLERARIEGGARAPAPRGATSRSSACSRAGAATATHGRPCGRKSCRPMYRSSARRSRDRGRRDRACSDSSNLESHCS